MGIRSRFKAKTGYISEGKINLYRLIYCDRYNVQHYLRILIFMALFWPAFIVQAQDKKKIHLSFMPTFGQKPVAFDNTNYHISGTDSISFETFKCYISAIGFEKDGKRVFEEKNSYHLVDAAEQEGMHIEVSVPSGLVYDVVTFNLGVDSVTNVSGILTGDLDPAKGMYWAWQSGYINLKLEGRSNLCATRKNAFSFHLGGYSSPGYAMQAVTLNAKYSDNIFIELPLDKFIATIDLGKQNSIMIPGKEAVDLSKRIAGLFKIPTR